MPESREFANMFHVSVEEGLGNTLGVSVMQTLKNLLSYCFEIYAKKPVELHRELSRVFGFGAITLERMISKELCRRLGLDYSAQLDLKTRVNLAWRAMIANERGDN